VTARLAALLNLLIAQRNPLIRRKNAFKAQRTLVLRPSGPGMRQWAPGKGPRPRGRRPHALCVCSPT
jgi:hypothetical protein